MRYVLVPMVASLPLLVIIGVTGYFRLGSETRALRNGFMDGVHGEWDTRFAFHVGRITTFLAQAGMHFVHLPPEARTALDAARGAEAGIYRLRQAVANLDPAAVFTAADKAMKSRGWERLVGVAKGCELVAVYVPVKSFSAKHTSLCVAVLHDRDLVVASARCNAEPLLQLATRKLEADENAGWRQSFHLAGS
jgi:hypothetical protein